MTAARAGVTALLLTVQETLAVPGVWGQGRDAGRLGRLCLLTALGEVCGIRSTGRPDPRLHEPARWQLRDEALWALAAAFWLVPTAAGLTPARISDVLLLWQDRPGRRLSEVLALLHRAQLLSRATAARQELPVAA